jgi:uncharacterized protein YjbJ (UPF0337 family)
MSNSDKMNAEKNKLVGNVKEKVGTAIGSPGLRDEGTADRVKGNVQSAVENVKDAVKHALK